jgi:hypothetical protein
MKGRWTFWLGLRGREGRNHGLINYIDNKVKCRQFSIFLDATFCFGVYLVDESMVGAMSGEFLPFKYICTVTLLYITFHNFL